MCVLQLKIQWKNHQAILVILLLVDNMHNVELLETVHLVLAFLTTWELHQTVDQSVWAIMSVPATEHAKTRNVVIHVLDPVEQMLNAELLVTHPCVSALLVLLVILSVSAFKLEVYFLYICNKQM